MIKGKKILQKYKLILNVQSELLLTLN